MIFFINQFLPVFPVVVLWLVYFGALSTYFKKACLPVGREWLGRFVNFKILLIFTAAFRAFQAGLLSITQYYVWSGAELTKVLVNSPLSPEVPLSSFLRENLSFIFNSKLGYFLFYSWGHFWANALLSIIVAFVFYAFLRVLRKHNDRFFYEGETELGLLLALIVGWPSIILFIPLIFLAVVLVSVFRGVYLKETYTTLGAPMLLAALITMIFGSNLIEALGLTVLKI